MKEWPPVCSLAQRQGIPARVRGKQNHEEKAHPQEGSAQESHSCRARSRRWRHKQRRTDHAVQFKMNLDSIFEYVVDTRGHV